MRLWMALPPLMTAFTANAQEFIYVAPDIEVIAGNGGPVLNDPAFLSRLSELGDGDPAIGYRHAVLLVGLSSSEDFGAGAVINTQMVVPGVNYESVAPALEVNPSEPPWLGPGVAEIIAAPAGPVVLRVRAKRSQLQPMLPRYLEVAHATLRGGSAIDAGVAWDAAREERGAGAVSLMQEVAEELGGELLEADARIGEGVISVPGQVVGDLANDARWAAIEMAYSETNNDNPAGYWLNVYGLALDGIELESLMQTPIFYDQGFEGAGAELGMVEGGAANVWRRHPGFEDAGGTDRYENRAYSFPSYSNPNPDPGSDHATAVASIIIGDLTEGQDSSISDNWEQRRRSGIARKSELMGMSNDSRSRVVSQMTSSSRNIMVVNMAFSTTVDDQPADPQCEGRDSWSRSVNELFESGVVAVKSAGNDEWSDTSDCTVGAPGSAIGAFTVGAYQVTSDGDGTQADFDTSRGGTSTEGRGRTVVSMSAPTSYQFPYIHRDDCGWHYGSSWGNCTQTSPGTMPDTSGAVPMVTGAFGVFNSWYSSAFGALDPGAIHAILLLQGDRRTESGFFATTGFDSVWGAGRMRMRKFDLAGLDDPARWTAGSTCIDHGEVDVIPVTTSDVSTDVDVLKAVSFTYDHRHDDNGSVNNDRVSLKLAREVSPGAWQTVVTDASSDNKHRVFVYGPTPGRYAVVLTGVSVSSDNEGCGSNSTRVWFTYMHEDSDRESGESLDTVRPEDEDIN